ncbi:MAG: hypothetical protein AAGI52_05675 [Bacteroidota bacterium]
MRSLLFALTLVLTVSLVGCDASDPFEASPVNASPSAKAPSAYLSGPSSIRPGDECEYTLVGASVSSLGWGGPSGFSVESEHFNSATIKAVGSGGGGNIFAHSDLGYPVKKYVTISSSAPLCSPAPKTGTLQTVTGPDSVRPGSTCTFAYNSPTPANGWGSFSSMSLDSGGSYTATFTATGSHGTYSRIWAFNQESHTPIKKTVLISNSAPVCSSLDA